MDIIPCFDAPHLEAACKVLADTTMGLKGDEIGYVLEGMGIADPDPTQETTLARAKARAGKLKAILEARGTHPRSSSTVARNCSKRTTFMPSLRRRKVWRNAFVISPGLLLMVEN